MNIFVSNLNYRVRREDLTSLFTPFGEISSARIIVNKETRRSRGYGFVEMSEEDGMKAIESLNGTEYMGRTINVAVGNERPQPQEQPEQ
ncbi:MAG TPA: RNA-binding protein [Candidatus Coprenecus stercoravium]|uniref:RNA-binding protein n=1 Tax=Candidatus Coprenecus stercoravium TaxID=2840735 RepID=A0A9D2GQ89_9BACT|nr:RNA-binding protein [Candidatus Coprenecus stercoravium]